MPLFGSAGWRQPFALTWSDQETGNEQAGPPPKVATCVDASYARAFFGRHFARSRVLTCVPLPDRACLHAREGASDAAFHKSGIPAGVCFCHDCPCWKITRPLPEDPVDRRAFTALFQAELKAQAVLIEKLRHQSAGHRAHRLGASSETAGQLQLALETTVIAIAAMTARLRDPPDKRAGIRQAETRPAFDGLEVWLNSRTEWRRPASLARRHACPHPRPTDQPH